MLGLLVKNTHYLTLVLGGHLRSPNRILSCRSSEGLVSNETWVQMTVVIVSFLRARTLKCTDFSVNSIGCKRELNRNFPNHLRDPRLAGQRFGALTLLSHYSG